MPDGTDRAEKAGVLKGGIIDKKIHDGVPVTFEYASEGMLCELPLFYFAADGQEAVSFIPIFRLGGVDVGGQEEMLSFDFVCVFRKPDKIFYFLDQIRVCGRSGTLRLDGRVAG